MPKSTHCPPGSARSRTDAQRDRRRSKFLSFESLETRDLLATYVIDPVLGSDTNPGTATQPFKTARNLSYTSAETNPRYIQLQPGDKVWLRDGVHDWSADLATHNQDAAFILRNVHGTAAQPIVVEAYPGERPIVKAREGGNIENAAIYVLQSSHVKVKGLEVTGTFGPGIRVIEADFVEIANNYVHDVDGVQNNNLAGIYTNVTRDLEIHHNLLHDNYDHAAAAAGRISENSRNIVIFGDGSDRVKVHHNKVFNTPRADGQMTGEGIWIKHASAIPGASFEFHDNIVRDVFFSAIGSQASNVYMHHNLIINGDEFLTSAGDNVTRLGGFVLERNTIQGSGAFHLRAAEGVLPSSGLLTMRDNIVVDDDSFYNVDRGIVQLFPYGTDDEYRQTITPQNLQLQRNVYFNPLTPPKFNIFGANGGDYGQLGGIIELPAWQQLGYDPGSIVANPHFTTSFVPQNSAAANAGWYSSTQPRLTFYVPNDTFRESAGTSAATLTIVRAGVNLNSPLTVTLTTSDTTEARLPAMATFLPGQSVIQVQIAANDDNLNEPTRAVQLIGTANVNGQPLQASEWVRVLQDTAPPPLPTFSINDVIVVEGNPGMPSTAVFTVTLTSNQTTIPSATVNVSIVGGTATLGSDLNGGSATLSFTSAQRIRAFSVPITPDTIPEPDEKFFVRLSGATNATISDPEGMGTIVNDDFVRLSIADAALDEGHTGARSLTFTLTLSAASPTPVTVEYFTQDQSAVAGQDYTGQTGSVTFPANVTSRQVTIPVIGDRRPEGHETFFVRLRNPQEATIGDGEAVGTIRNDDAQPLQANFDGDLRADRAVWRPSFADWYVMGSLTNVATVQQLGLSTDIPVNGDFDGDGRTDHAVWRPATGVWYVIHSSTRTVRSQQWGLSGDAPVPGDFDADGRTDFAVFRPGNSTWYILHATGVQRTQALGLSTDLPVPADYDGDGRTDLATWRPSTGMWYVWQSTNAALISRQYGLPGDVPVPGNYDGDNRVDFAVWRPASATWYVLNSSNNLQVTRQWGLSTDIPQPADFTGDGRTDFAVWRPAQGNWYIVDSTNNTTTTSQWGLPGDRPVSNALVSYLTKRVTGI